MTVNPGIGGAHQFTLTQQTFAVTGYRATPARTAEATLFLREATIEPLVGDGDKSANAKLSTSMMVGLSTSMMVGLSTSMMVGLTRLM